jgi:aryl-alcohol dehydrogenase-like predicted oxidoreductase
MLFGSLYAFPNHERFAMRLTKLGKSPLKVSALGLGCMGMSEFYGAQSEEESVATLHRAIDLGVNFVDTADVYGRGANEELVGRALQGRRQQVVLATKFGSIRDEEGHFTGVNGHPKYVRQACDASLRRLQVESIDLYYQHRVDRAVPIEETVGAMSRLVEAGKVRFLGLSEASPASIRRAYAIHPIDALQTEYSLWTRDPEEQIFPVCQELGITFVAYSPLGRGFLTGRFKRVEDLAEDDWRRDNPRFQGENFARNLELVRRVEQIATKKGWKPAQLALAWVLAQSEAIIPLPGTSNRMHLEENLAAMELPLTLNELAQLNQAAPLGAAAGERYAEAAMKAVNG